MRSLQPPAAWCLHQNPTLMTKMIYGPRGQSAKGLEQLWLCFTFCKMPKSSITCTFLHTPIHLSPALRVAAQLDDNSLYKDFCSMPPIQRTIWGCSIKGTYYRQDTPASGTVAYWEDSKCWCLCTFHRGSG